MKSRAELPFAKERKHKRAPASITLLIPMLLTVRKTLLQRAQSIARDRRCVTVLILRYGKSYTMHYRLP